jgi:ATP-dependent DNA ligase
MQRGSRAAVAPRDQIRRSSADAQGARLTKQYLTIAAALELEPDKALLDGEIVSEDERG